MAFDMFLKIDGIAGESSDGHGHKDEIEVVSWNWGMLQKGNTHQGTGSGSGKVEIQDLTVTKWVDRATPALMLSCAKLEPIEEIVLTVRKAGGKTPLEYVKITLKNAVITCVSTGGTGSDDRLSENVTIQFAKVDFEYSPQNSDGSGGAAIPFSWDIPKNKS